MNIFSNEPELKYLAETTIESRKKYAQFFTPYSIARFMAKWILGDRNKIKTILDPSIGLGVLIRAIIDESNTTDYDIKGYDIDSFVLSKCKKIFENEGIDRNVNLICKDYMFNDWNNKYDGIICNPPYFKFQDYQTKDDALQEFQCRLGMNLSGFTNIYALFLLKSVSQLNFNGRCAYIIPSEFLNSDYGKLVKEYLIRLKSLRYIIVFDFKKKVFDDALTTSSIFLFANDNQKDGVDFVSISSETELAEISNQISFYPNVSMPTKHLKFAEIDSSVKWRKYYQKNCVQDYKALVPFSTYAKVSRGIATGANDYFLFSLEKASRFNIPESYLEPVVSKSNQVVGHYFTKEDFLKLVSDNKDVFLLNVKDTKCQAVNDYIAFGEKMEIHKKHLTSHRSPWYSTENRLASPIWVSVFSRGGLRFIRNESEIRNLTTFHCVYINMFAYKQLDLLFAYLLSDISREIFSDNRREYGGGLEKFEPNDLNNSMVVNLDMIDDCTKSKILGLYNGYRASCLVNKPDVSLLYGINAEFKSFMLAI